MEVISYLIKLFKSKLLILAQSKTYRKVAKLEQRSCGSSTQFFLLFTSYIIVVHLSPLINRYGPMLLLTKVHTSFGLNLFSPDGLFLSQRPTQNPTLAAMSLSASLTVSQNSLFLMIPTVLRSAAQVFLERSSIWLGLMFFHLYFHKLWKQIRTDIVSLGHGS